MRRYLHERKEVARFMRRLYTQKLTTTSGGNISLLVACDRMLITPSANDKALTHHKEIVQISLNGENRTPRLKPSIETSMHRFIYKKCNNVHAIVHAHPPTATAFSALQTPINTHLIAEAFAILGEPILAPYALMGSHMLAEIVSEAATKSSIIILEKHGVLTTGRTLLEAFDRLEVLEAAAYMTFITNIMGHKNELNENQRKELDLFMNRL